MLLGIGDKIELHGIGRKLKNVMGNRKLRGSLYCDRQTNGRFCKGTYVTGTQNGFCPTYD